MSPRVLPGSSAPSADTRQLFEIIRTRRLTLPELADAWEQARSI